MLKTFNLGRRQSIFILVLPLLVLSLAVMVAPAQDASTDVQEQVYNLYQVDGNQLPEVVATANGQEITGLALERRTYIVQQSPVYAGALLTDVRQVALEQLIQEAVLVDAANDIGISASTLEATEFAIAQQELSLNGDDPAARDVYIENANQLGIKPDEFATHPEAIETYQRAMTLGRVYAYIRETLPEADRLNPDAVQEATEKFVDQNIEDLQVFIDYSDE